MPQQNAIRTILAHTAALCHEKNARCSQRRVEYKNFYKQTLKRSATTLARTVTVDHILQFHLLLVQGKLSSLSRERTTHNHPLTPARLNYCYRVTVSATVIETVDNLHLQCWGNSKFNMVLNGEKIKQIILASN